MTKAELARKTGLTRPTIDNRLAKGETEDDLLAAVPKAQPAKSKKKKAEETFIDAQRRKEIALANLREQELAIKAGELAPISEINNHVAGMILRSRDILLRIGPELRDRLAQESDAITIQKMIDAEVFRALAALSEFHGS